MTDRFLREKQCRDITGLSRTTRWRLERVGLFPKRYRISPGAVAWRESQVTEWLNSRTRDCDTGAGGDAP